MVQGARQASVACLLVGVLAAPDQCDSRTCTSQPRKKQLHSLRFIRLTCAQHCVQLSAARHDRCEVGCGRFEIRQRNIALQLATGLEQRDELGEVFVRHRSPGRLRPRGRKCPGPFAAPGPGSDYPTGERGATRATLRPRSRTPSGTRQAPSCETPGRGVRTWAPLREARGAGATRRCSSTPCSASPSGRSSRPARCSA